jgi:transcriptional accessory protein Tex/SPT6
MTYTTAEARRELLDTVAEAVAELGLASACLAEAYEQLDEQSGDRLEEECFRPVQTAYGRAKRTHAEFARRHGLQAAAFEQRPPGLPSQGAARFIERAVEAVSAADSVLAGLQDSMLPVEAGDEELRAGLKAVREPLGALPGRARQFLRGLGR